jgi:hypothetical protein
MKKTITILIFVFVAGIVYYFTIFSKGDIDLEDIEPIDISVNSTQVSKDKPAREPITGVIRARENKSSAPIVRSLIDSDDEPDYIADVLNPSIDRQKDVIAGERVLTFYDGNDLKEFLDIAENNGVIIIDTLDSMNSVRIQITDKNVLKKVLRAAPAPVESGGNYEVSPPNPENLPDIDSSLAKQQSGAFGNALDWIGIVGDNKDFGKGVLVAVLDSEVARNSSLEDSYAKVIHITSGKEDETHGTSVATIIAGNGNVSKGVAPSARILSIDVVDADGKGNTFDIAKGIQTAVDAGAQVINISMGSYGDSAIVRQAVEYATANDVVIVASTGNDSAQVAYPAAYSDVIAVGAVDSSSIITSFSNYGSEVDIAAPGLFVETSDPADNKTYFSGTSAAAPFVSGAIAAIISENPDLTAIEAGDLIIESANDVGVPGDDQLYGAGTLDLGRALNSNKEGIFDLAAGQPSISYDGIVPALMLFVQNRGTEYITDAGMDVAINGTTTTVDFGGVEVGGTVSKELLLDSYLSSNVKVIVVDYEAKMSGQTDSNLSNNRFHAEFQRR